MKFYNLDTPIEIFYDNIRVINILNKNNISCLYDLIACDINQVLSSDNCGEKSRSFIIEEFNNLRNLYEKKFDLIEIKKKYEFIMDEDVIVSPNSDYSKFKNQLKFSNMIDVYENDKLSLRDLTNCNMIFQFLELYNGNSPMDYISKETSRFHSYKEAYKFLFDVIDNLNSDKSNIYKKYNGIFQEKSTLEKIGNEYGVTRERIRQINKKTTYNIYKKLDMIQNKIRNTFNKNYYIPFSNPMLRIYCEYLYDNGFLNQEKIYDEKVFTKDNCLIYLIDKIENIIERKSFYDGPVEQSLLNLFEKKYFVENEKIFKNNTLINCVPLIMDEIGRSVNLNSNNDISLIYDKLEKEYKISTEYKDSRNIERVMGDTCILLDSRTYISEKHQIRTDISNVLEYIDENKVTNAQKIYLVFKEIWNSIDIYSHVGVYGYLKYFYNNRYNFAGRSFLISVIGKSSTWGEIVIDNIYRKVSPVSFNEMNNLYSALNNIIWTNLEGNFIDLVSWGDNSYYCASLLKISHDDINFITIYIYNSGGVLDKNLYTYIFNNKKNIIDDNYLYSEKQLLKFIKIKFSNVINYNYESKIYYI